MPVSKHSPTSNSLLKGVRNTKEVSNPITLQFSGKIPSWLNGTVIFNGPGTFDLEEGSVNHYLDGYAMLSKFEINGNILKYSSKHLETTAYKKALDAKKSVLVEFGTAPGTDKSKGFFSKMMIAFTPNDVSDNALNKTIEIGTKFYGLGDSTYFHEIDLSSLKINKTLNTSKTLGLASFSSDVYKDKNGDTYIFGSSLKPTVHYTIKRLFKKNTSKNLEEQFENVCSFPARWKFGGPSARNSFAITENHMIFVEVPLVINALKLAATNVKGYSVSDWFDWHPEEGTRFYIIHKASGKLVKTEVYSEKPFMVNSILNAFEDGDQITFDLISYPNAIPAVNTWYLKNIRECKTVEDFTPGEIHRYKIPIVEDIKKCPEGTSLLNNSSSNRNNSNLKWPAEAKRVGDRLIVSPEIMETGNYLDMGIINKNFSGQKCSFVYGIPCLPSIFINSPTSFGITKLDLDTGKVLRWEGKEYQNPHEPLFIPNPNGSSEDDGILLSLVKHQFLTQQEPDFLVAIDPKTMEEVGRVEFGFLDCPPPVCQHSTFLPKY